MTDEPQDPGQPQVELEDVGINLLGTGTPATSPRFGAPRYSDADAADFAACVNPITDAFDAAAAWVAQGTLASRPAPSSLGRFYMNTDGNNVGILDWDTGSAWWQVSPPFAVPRTANATIAPGEMTIAEGAGNYTFTLPTAPPINTRCSLVNASAANVQLNAGPGDGINCYGTTGSIPLRAGGKVDVQYTAGATWFVTSPLSSLLQGNTALAGAGLSAGYAYSSWVSLSNGGLPSDYPLSIWMPVPASVAPLEFGMSFAYANGSGSPNPAGSVRFWNNTNAVAVDGLQYDIPNSGVAWSPITRATIVQRCTSLAAGTHQFLIQMYAYGGGAAYCDFYIGGWNAAQALNWWVKQLPV